MLSSGARGEKAVRTYFTHFMTIFECNQLVPGGDSRVTKSLKEDTTKHTYRDKRHGVLSSLIPQSHD